MLCTALRGFSPNVSYFLNRLDVLGCVFVGIRFGYIYYKKYGLIINILIKNKYLILVYCLPFILLRISEHDKYNKNLKNLYIITHSLWHISIFLVIHNFLLNFIYNS